MSSTIHYSVRFGAACEQSVHNSDAVAFTKWKGQDVDDTKCPRHFHVHAWILQHASRLRSEGKSDAEVKAATRELKAKIDLLLLFGECRNLSACQTPHTHTPRASAPIDQRMHQNKHYGTNTSNVR